ncbi:uncharacterized protein LOC114527147 [Dendronephthya gigantea]|uniref:uncharacterized protein LOC114527147 n=1 Tax=Dendronephthya gigantea TaxID=151771 RepID=UPI00106D8B46|nr:uncharacterized protein LOC114527147 [Dendronephthya gigantea]
MECYVGGYPQERFRDPVDKNFFCPICTDVLRDPVQCHNQHYFCKACIRQHLKNARTCPICVEQLTEESLIVPPRIVSDYLNSLIINCDHTERGCQNVMELENLSNHTLVCNFRPATCPDRRCGMTVNMEDLEQHKKERCIYRLVYCEECDKEMSAKKHGKHTCILSNEIKEMKAMLSEMKDEVTKLNSKLNELMMATHKGDKGGKSSSQTQSIPLNSVEIFNSILVLGGNNKMSLNSVEMYSNSCATWVNLQPTIKCRVSSTAHFFKGKILVTGGHCDGTAMGSLEYMDLSQGQWFPFPHELPVKCHGHKSFILNDHLWVIGGMLDRQPCSNTVYVMMLTRPYTSKLMCELQQPLAYHGIEVFDVDIVILGGSTSGYHNDAVDDVSLYSTTKNKIQRVQALPFPIMDMATVKHGDDIVIIGGRNQRNEILNSVFKYNYKKCTCEWLPNMKSRRAECAAAIFENKIYVMGGFNFENGYLNSVECLDLENQIWEDMPPLGEPKNKITAVYVPLNCL